MCNEHLNEEKLKSDSPRVTQEKSALRNRRHFNDQCTIQYFQRRWIDGVEKKFTFPSIYSVSAPLLALVFWGSSGLFHPRVGLSIIYFDRRSRVPVLFPEEAQTHIFPSFGKQEMENLAGKCLQEKSGCLTTWKSVGKIRRRPIHLNSTSMIILTFSLWISIFQDVEFSIPQL